MSQAADSLKWYVLNFIAPSAARRESAVAVVDRFNAGSSRVELFAPTFVEVHESEGRVKRSSKPLLYHYVFVRGTIDDVKALCAGQNGFSFVVSNATADRYVTVHDVDMHAFMTIARFYGNKLPCFAIDDIELEEGDLVEIVQGDFPGLRGRFIPKQRGVKGKVLIAVSQCLAAAVYDIRADYVRVLEFAHDSRRIYDQLDAFLPRLLEALRRYSESHSLDAETASPLIVFTRRLGLTRVDNPKIDAKLQLMLLASAVMLGDSEAASTARERFDKLQNNITERWTGALRDLCLHVIDGRPLPPLQAETEATSRRQTLIRQYYRQIAAPVQAL